MPALPTLTLTFPTKITEATIPAFRHTLITLAFKHQLLLARHYLHPDLFSNESHEGKEYDRYPLVQYKIIDGRAAVTGMAQGAQALALLWQKWEDTTIHGTSLLLTRKGASAMWKDTRIEVKKKPRTYRLSRWMPCNQNDVPAYFGWDKKEQQDFMRHKLAMHIAKLSNDLKLGLPDIAIDSLDMGKEDRVVFKTPKERPLIDCTFSARIRLPDGIGLGNSPAFGFGILTRDG